MSSIVKLGIFILAWIAVSLGSCVMLVSKATNHWNRDQHRIVKQQLDDSHKLHDWRLK